MKQTIIIQKSVRLFFALLSAGLLHACQNGGHAPFELPSIATSYEMVYGPNTYDQEKLLAKVTGNSPPKMFEVINRWKRFSGQTYYPNFASVTADPVYCQTSMDGNGVWANGTAPGGGSINPNTASACNTESMNSLSWVYLGGPDRLFNIMNTTYYVGFFSPLKFHTYTSTTVVSSVDKDDDAIGVSIAVYVDPANNNVHTLSAYRSQGGQPPVPGWGLLHKVNGALVNTINPKSVGGTNKNSSPTTGDAQGWNGRMSKVKIVREGNIIKAYTGVWGTVAKDLTIDDNSLIQIDLSDPANNLTVFMGAQSYGYESISQAKATFSDLSFVTPQADTDPEFIYDLKTNQVYQKKTTGVGYDLLTGVKATDRLSYPMKYSNIETLKTFLITSPTHIVEVTD